MATAESVKAKIRGLIDAANTATGSTDADLTTAVSTLVDGYGKGSGEDALEKLLDKSITEVSSNVSKIDHYTFYNCTKLEKYDLPNVTYIGDYAFYKCPIKSIDFPLLKTAGKTVFASCRYAETLNLPLLTTLGQNALDMTESLKEAIFPELTAIQGYTFNSSNVQRLIAPKVTSIAANAFPYTIQLYLADFTALTNIAANAFSVSSGLKALIIRGNTVCTLANVSGLKSHHADLCIYVPSALVTEYQVATNWSEFADRFRAVEDYTVDGTVSGEFDESLI